MTAWLDAAEGKGIACQQCVEIIETAQQQS
jgi:hypothetical protein